jgi:ATP-binding cassette subfamily B protein
MGFILDGLESESYDRSYGDRQLLARIVGYFRPHAGRMALVALLMVLQSLAWTGGPILLSGALDAVAQDPAVRTMAVMAALVLALGVAGWALNWLRGWLTARVTGDVILTLRTDVFDAIMRHDLSFYDAHPSGKIVSRVTSDTQDFANVVTLTLDLVSQVLLVGLLVVWLLRINVLLTLLMIVFAPLAVVLALSFRRIARRVTLQARQVTAKINAQIQESISGIMVAKAFRQEHAIYTTFSENNRQAYRVGLRRGLVLNTIFPVVGMASGLGTALLLYAGGLTTRNSLVTPGDWYLFMQAVGFFWYPLLGIASFWSQFQDGLSAAERVFALIDAEPHVVQQAAEPVGTLHGAIEFRHLRFAYTGAETVLPDFSLSIRPKETLALVGHTGAGKSSVARLIARFYEFQGGELQIDGRDIRRFDLGQYRQQIGLVPQEPFLFSGTVRENIRHSRPEASDAEVEAAARQISNGEWVDDLPNGLDTDVGERGANLSMGQRQLVALARVVLKDPAILILDEATASVDPFTEMQIQEGLAAVMAARTAIVIAHRLSTVKRADRIIVMKDGQIIEEGTHHALLAQGGHYAELYNTYFRHQELDYRPPEAEEGTPQPDTTPSKERAGHGRIRAVVSGGAA